MEQKTNGCSNETGSRIRFADFHSVFLAGFALAVVSLVPYLQVYGHRFVMIDDPTYILKSPQVPRGLTLEGVGWAFTTFHAANWHPLTWLSHMLDVSLFGMDPGFHHLTSLFLHLLNTFLVYGIFRRATGDEWRSVFVAALFAVHPLHVESVAWVSERKDVLSATFLLLAIRAYLRYVRHPGTVRYLPIAALFALSLMAKPMGVTFPFMLILLDVWPLGRLHMPGGMPVRADSSGRFPSRLFRSIAEKAPLFLLSLASCIVTLFAQTKAMSDPLALPVSIRIYNAIVSYARYLGKTIWPDPLVVFYPHPWEMAGAGFPAWQVAAAALLLLGITAGVLWSGKCRPSLLVGWAWFLGTLVPAIGIVQVGGQSMADRYTYIPLIGLFVGVAWGLFPPSKDRPRRNRILFAAGGVAVFALATVSWFQVSYWKNDIALFGHAVAEVPNNAFARNCLGVALMKEGRVTEAIPHFQKVLSLGYSRNTVEALANLGSAYMAIGLPDVAEQSFRQALMIQSNSLAARYNLASLMARQGRLEEAIAQLREAQRILPGNPEVAALLDRLSTAAGATRR